MKLVYLGHSCEGDAYKSLINFVAAKSAEFILVGRFKGRTPEMRALKKFFLREESGNKWPGRQVSGDPHQINYFRVSTESTQLLLNITDSLYNWGRLGPESYLEDLGFYRKDGRALLASVTHEQQGWLKLEEGELKKFETLALETGIEFSTDPKYMFWGMIG